MGRLRKCLIFILSICFLSVLAPQDAYSWRWRPFWRRNPAPRQPKPRTGSPARVERKKKKKWTKILRRYDKKHDLNNDGAVNVKDRLLWIKKTTKTHTIVYVADDNKGLIDEIDLDGDGNVEDIEMMAFFEEYDTNRNGVLDDEEIEAARD